MNNVTALPNKRVERLRTDARAHKPARLYLIGTMRAVGHSGEDILPRARKTQAVLAYLCCAQGERVSRSRVAGIIWDRSGEAQAKDSLRHALSQIAQATDAWRIEMD